MAEGERGGLGLPEAGGGSVVVNLLPTRHTTQIRSEIKSKREREREREREGALGSPKAEGGLVITEKAHYTG